MNVADSLDAENLVASSLRRIVDPRSCGLCIGGAVLRPVERDEPIGSHCDILPHGSRVSACNHLTVLLSPLDAIAGGDCNRASVREIQLLSLRAAHVGHHHDGACCEK